MYQEGSEVILPVAVLLEERNGCSSEAGRKVIVLTLTKGMTARQLLLSN